MTNNYVNANLEFFKGALFMLSNVYRAYGSKATVEYCIADIDVIEEVARKSAEYDLIKLREVINNLPMGADANYTHFVIIPNYDVDVDNVVVGDINTFSVKALSNNEPVEVAQFDTFTDAEMAIEKWRKEVEENNQTKFL